MSDNLSAYPHIGFEVEDLIRECLFPFPYIWVSIISILNLWVMPHVPDFQFIDYDCECWILHPLSYQIA